MTKKFFLLIMLMLCLTNTLILTNHYELPINDFFKGIISGITIVGNIYILVQLSKRKGLKKV
ncbi:hypothetical protein EJP77_09445 [Paenibacillus zeisoli]|uniref:Uncharacterized protein n=1 Tax=Paenibacillus zeisoli TaxID=2496267 RepID=A0A433XCA4_9BACL|nr:hypothetical protein [Paenibacillus zeisoli]RUT31610.1 hypothetical protein EJP77_09445 [Paenibacillus zeisoli]